MDPISTAVDRLYDVLAARPPARLEGCPHCVRPEDGEHLGSVPLRTLTAEQLGRFAFKAMSTWGIPSDYRYFLPRILELVVTGRAEGMPGLYLDVVVGKLGLAGFSSWETREREAVLAVFDAAWVRALASADSRAADDVLAPIAQLVPALDPYLATWEATRTLPAALQLGTLVEDIVGGHSTWKPPFPHAAVLRGWVADPARGAWLEESWERWFDDPEAFGRLAHAADAWRWWLRDR